MATRSDLAMAKNLDTCGQPAQISLRLQNPKNFHEHAKTHNPHCLKDRGSCHVEISILLSILATDPRWIQDDNIPQSFQDLLFLIISTALAS